MAEYYLDDHTLIWTKGTKMHTVNWNAPIEIIGANDVYFQAKVLYTTIELERIVRWTADDGRDHFAKVNRDGMLISTMHLGPSSSVKPVRFVRNVPEERYLIVYKLKGRWHSYPQTMSKSDADRRANTDRKICDNVITIMINEDSK
jgi:hypothetical protein